MDPVPLNGVEVTLLARGPHLNAVQWNGIQVEMANGTKDVIPDIEATDDPGACGKQDVVILAVKAQQIPPVVGRLAGLFGPETAVMTTQNGIPWWYFQRHGGPHEGYRIRAVDPDGTIAAGIDAERIIGSAVFLHAEIARPGVIRHIEGRSLPIGELDGAETPRILALSALLEKAGLKAPVVPDIRTTLWLKTLGHLGFDAISALTHATLSDICEFPLARDLVTRLMGEAEEVAGRLGISLEVPIEKRIAGAERIGRYKTALLKDVEAGRALEADALIGAVLELGDLTGVATPHIRTAYAMTRLLEWKMEKENVSLQPVASNGGRPAEAAG